MTFASNPFVVTLVCTFETKVRAYLYGKRVGDLCADLEGEGGNRLNFRPNLRLELRGLIFCGED